MKNVTGSQILYQPKCRLVTTCEGSLLKFQDEQEGILSTGVLVGDPPSSVKRHLNRLESDNRNDASHSN